MTKVFGEDRHAGLVISLINQDQRDIQPITMEMDAVLVTEVEVEVEKEYIQGLVMEMDAVLVRSGTTTTSLFDEGQQGLAPDTCHRNTSWDA